MRAARIEIQRERNKIPLVVRGRFERTFFGLGLFASTTLFLCGAYLLTEAMRDPLEASELAVLIAGFALALASFLITYLTWPRSRMALARHEEAGGLARRWKRPVITVYGEAVERRQEVEQMSGNRKHLPGPI
jgi:hypothetical protein